MHCMVQGGNVLHGALMGLTCFAAGESVVGLGKRWGAGLGVKALQTGIVAVAGGTVAELGGGNFANGAMTAAFAFLFNHLGHLHLNKADCMMYENRMMMKARLEAQGYLTLDDANLWYQIGEGVPLTMDATKLGIEKLLQKMVFNAYGESFNVNTFMANKDVGLVY